MARNAQKCRVPGANWVQYEYAFDVKPCDDARVKEIMLFREPWERVCSLLLKKRRPEGRIRMARDCLLNQRGCDKVVIGKRKGYWLFDNGLVRMLNGRQIDAIPFGGLGAAHLERAKNVASRMDGYIETKDLGAARRGEVYP